MYVRARVCVCQVCVCVSGVCVCVRARSAVPGRDIWKSEDKQKAAGDNGGLSGDSATGARKQNPAGEKARSAGSRPAWVGVGGGE